MGLPDYFGRNALAVSQVVSGLDEDRLSVALQNVRVAITLGYDANANEGQALSDLLVRLLARLYPTLLFRSDAGPGHVEALEELARRINPRVELTGEPTVELVVGPSKLQPTASQRIYVGSSGWSGMVSTYRPLASGDTDIPFGAGIGACLGASNLFRYTFLDQPQLDNEAVLVPPNTSGIPDKLNGIGDVVLAGCGAIGNAAAWALARLPAPGNLTLVDHEAIELGNLQRYVLAERSDEGQSKVATLSRHFVGAVAAVPEQTRLDHYLQSAGHRIEKLLLALDSARDRRVGQASLPKWIANAWTQPGDAGLSTHDFLSGACVSCLYLPDRQLMNEDAIIAETFGVPERLVQIRTLLYKNAGTPRDVLEAIASAHGVDLERLLPFEGRSVRSLYREGFCGGAAIPLGQLGTPRSDVHVPLAHQSALAGVLLAAAVALEAEHHQASSQITQVNVLKPAPQVPTRPAAKDPRGVCICQDGDYCRAYREKYQEGEATTD